MKNRKYILTLCLVAFFYLLNAQSTMGYPVSFGDTNAFNPNFRTSLNKLVLPSYNNVSLIVQADSIGANCTTCSDKKYFGKGILQNIDVKTSAHYYNPNINNGKLWIYKIESSTALALQVYFSKFILPPEASLFIYNASKTVVYGPYTSYFTPDDTTKAVHFSSPLLSDNNMYIEYFEPNNASFSGNIKVNNVIHAFRAAGGQFGSSLNCTGNATLKNAACQAGWESVANSVGIIIAYNPSVGWSGWCSGTLLNNTNQDGEGYFLTAGHCNYPNTFGYDPSTWQFYFDYQLPDCNNTTSYLGYNKIAIGATILSTDMPSIFQYPAPSGDYLLLKFIQSKEYLQGLNLCYSGWESKDIVPTINTSDNYYFVHHPGGDYKKISIASNLRNMPSLYGFPINKYYTLNFSNGTIQGGSSGCGVFDSNKKLIGTQSGNYNNNAPADPDYCDYSTFVDAVGKFSKHWAEGNFKPWLDPANVINGTTNTSLGSKCYIPAGATGPTYGGIYTYTFTGGHLLADFSEGIKVNGRPSNNSVNGVAYLCDNNSTVFTATPLKALEFYLKQNSLQKIPCGFLNSNVGLGSSNPSCWVEKINKCYCGHTAYKLSITELNYDLTPTGIAVNQISTPLTDVGQYTPNSLSINPVALGLNFKKGHYYSYFAESTANGYWDYSQRVFYIFTDDVNINNANITQPIYANNTIEINNSIISNSPDITASMQIQITGETSISNANVYISNLNCNQFRVINPNNTPTKNVEAENNDLETNINLNQTKDKNSSLKNKVIPNPTSGNFIWASLKINFLS